MGGEAISSSCSSSKLSTLYRCHLVIRMFTKIIEGTSRGFSLWVDHKMSSFTEEVVEDQQVEQEDAEADDAFPLFVRTVTGDLLNITVLPNTDILAIKTYLADQTGVDVNTCVLSCNAQDLADDKTFDDYGIKENQTLVQRISLPGGYY